MAPLRGGSDRYPVVFCEAEQYLLLRFLEKKKKKYERSEE
jgi:hypothetical protein